jgi:hypothetical protein
MDDSKPTPSPLYSGFKLVATYTTLDVDATLYNQLNGSLLYLSHTHPNISFAIGWFLVLFPDI